MNTVTFTLRHNTANRTIDVLYTVNNCVTALMHTHSNKSVKQARNMQQRMEYGNGWQTTLEVV